MKNRQKSLNHQITERKIQSFFEWLKENIAALATSRDIQIAMTKKIKSLHPDLHWEVGPFSKEEKFFAFSPNLDFNLLPITYMLADKAPKISGWKFLSAKPKKNWKNRVITLRANGSVKKINCDNWRYYLTSFNDEFFDVNIVPDKNLDLTAEELEYVADLFVEFELGEELYIEAIDRVNIIEVVPNPDVTNGVDVLFEHVLSTWKRTH